MSEKKTVIGGISFLNALGLLFIALKLTNNVAWSWWWITIPFWGPIVLLVVVSLVMLLLALLISLFPTDKT